MQTKKINQPAFSCQDKIIIQIKDLDKLVDICLDKIIQIGLRKNQDELVNTFLDKSTHCDHLQISFPNNNDSQQNSQILYLFVCVHVQQHYSLLLYYLLLSTNLLLITRTSMHLKPNCISWMLGHEREILFCRSIKNSSLKNMHFSSICSLRNSF